FCFGMPKAVRSSGYSKMTTGVDHLLTQYVYDDVPLVTAEGGWCMQKGFPFQMSFTLNFERATAVYDLNAPQPLVLYQDGRVDAVPIDPVMGYRLEIEYFLA